MIDTYKDLGRRSLAELDDLHYECEVCYNRRIMASGKGSPERAWLFTEAYDTLVAILTERRKRFGVAMSSLGLPPDAADGIAEHLGARPARVLDVGCGAGVLVGELIGRGYQATGIDVAPRLIALGRERMALVPRSSGCGDALHCGNFLHDGPIDAGGYDLVYSNDVLEYLQPDEAADFMGKVYRLLNPGGMFWLVTPNRWTGPGDATILRHPPGTASRGLHLKEYTLAELVTLLRAAGFEMPQSRLWAGGRFRSPSGSRAAYTRVKVGLEQVLAQLPPLWRRRIMGIMNYASLHAQKPIVAGRPSDKGSAGAIR